MEKKPEHTRHQPSRLLKVVLFGPESTGKTTLAQKLAKYYKTTWAPEFMREYLQKKWNEKGELVTKEDLIPIAKGQLKNEEMASINAKEILFCDTNLFEIKVYSEYYYNGFCPEEIKNKTHTENYDLYLLTYIDTPWEADDLRDRPKDRLTMFRNFEMELIKQKFPYFILKGTLKERMEKAIESIETLRQ